MPAAYTPWIHWYQIIAHHAQPPSGSAETHDFGHHHGHYLLHPIPAGRAQLLRPPKHWHSRSFSLA
ncbi:hypothetical protein BJV74DRAFT_853967 [Russula compacta]|nr:hypothetical protein BJV74DRAFT_853967 [Russula compacta]